MEHWDLRTLAVERTPPADPALHARGVTVRRDRAPRGRAAAGPPGPRARPRASSIEGDVRVSVDGSVDRRAAPGTLLVFDPNERHEVRAETDARLLLVLAPWPGAGPSGRARRVDARVRGRRSALPVPPPRVRTWVRARRRARSSAASGSPPTRTEAPRESGAGALRQVVGCSPRERLLRPRDPELPTAALRTRSRPRAPSSAPSSSPSARCTRSSSRRASRPRTSTASATALIYAAMLRLYRESEPIDVLTVTERLKADGDGEAAATVDELTAGVPAAGNVRHYARIVREQALLRRMLNATYEIQASVAERRAAPRELVEQAERAMLEVAHDDRQKDFRSIEEVLARGDRQAAPPVDRGHGAHRHAVRLQGPRRDHRRLPARQPHHHRRAPLDGEVGARDEHRRERRRSTTTAPSRSSASRCPRRSSRSASSPARPA